MAETENHENKPAKRKELSPVQPQNADRTNEPCSTNSTNTFYTDTNGLNRQKKIKLGHSSKTNSTLKITVHKAVKTTPEKENCNTASQSPRKYSSNNKNLKGDCNKTKESDDISENKNSWSPLTSLSREDVLEMNEFADGFGQIDEINNENGLLNGNLVNKKVKTPRKVLPFHNHVQNGVVEIEKSVNALKSPDEGKTVVHVFY